MLEEAADNHSGQQTSQGGRPAIGRLSIVIKGKRRRPEAVANDQLV